MNVNVTSPRLINAVPKPAVKVAIVNQSIFFNEEKHKYTDSSNNVYTSCTTIISKYKEEFRTWEIAVACSRKRDSKYFGWKPKDIIADWKKISDEALARGNDKHGYLEDVVKKSSGYKRINGFINDQIYTVRDLGTNITFGRLSIDYFVQTKINEKYPAIFELIVDIVNKGYFIYSEICTFNYEYLTSGLIDILFVKEDFSGFVILDWKTNTDDIQTKSGYFKKDKQGVRTDIWIHTREYFKSPIDHLEHSTWNEYSIQTSIYAWLTEQLGIPCKAIFLAHIKHELDDFGREKVKIHVMPYLKNEAEMLIKHHYQTYVVKTRNNQLNLFV